LKKWNPIIGKVLMSEKKCVEMQLVDIEERLEIITDKIDKLGSCYDNFMENQTGLNTSIHMLLEKLVENVGGRIRVVEDDEDNPWEFSMMEEV
jgi:DNA anti-recombination protein RmuC